MGSVLLQFDVVDPDTTALRPLPHEVGLRAALGVGPVEEIADSVDEFLHAIR